MDNYTKNGFRGEYEFLSNMYRCDVNCGGNKYPSAENVFQVLKCKNTRDRNKFLNVSPVEAKRLGKRIPLVDDWNSIRDEVMYYVCSFKFHQNKDLAKKLVNTGDIELVEVNNWNDTYWGVCRGKGENRLGKILMRIREELKSN